MGFLIKMERSKDSFSQQEQKIIQFVLTQPHLAKEITSQALAEAVGVSQSCVIKFTQKLGLKGFSAFKLALGEELARGHQQHLAASHTRLHNNITAEDSLATVAEKLLIEKQRALRATTDANDMQRLQQAIQRLHTAQRVQLIAMGGSALVAKELAQKLLKIGITALFDADPHVQLTVIHTLSPQDVLMVISFSGRLKEIQQMTHIAKQQGVPIIALTGIRQNPLHDQATTLLYSVADETGQRSSSIASRTAQNTLTDILFMGLLQQREQRVAPWIAASTKAIHEPLSASELG